MWLIFLSAPMEGKRKTKEKTTDWSFLKSKKFWLLTGLLFCQNAAEFSVNGWMVTYFKDSGIISGMLSTYTVIGYVDGDPDRPNVDRVCISD